MAKYSNIRWGVRPQLALANLRAFDRAFTLSDELPTRLLQTHHQIEEIVRNHLTTQSTRDPSRTTPTGVNESKVADIIRSSVTKRPHGLIGGTGNIKYMDQNDPLLTLQDRTPSSDNVRLWRILEWGVEEIYTLQARNPQKPMVFWWKRENKLFVGVPGKAPHNLPISEHPGQRGRQYWETSMYVSEGIFRTNMHAQMQLIVSRYSNR